MARPRPGTVSPGRCVAGLANMQIQAHLTAAAINPKRLAAALLGALITLWTGTLFTSTRPRPRGLRLDRLGRTPLSIHPLSHPA
jgi:hypothetical protein